MHFDLDADQLCNVSHDSVGVQVHSITDLPCGPVAVRLIAKQIILTKENAMENFLYLFRLDSTIDALENALDCLEARLQKSIADAEADDDDEVEFESIICKFERKSPTKLRVFDDDGSADIRESCVRNADEIWSGRSLGMRVDVSINRHGTDTTRGRRMPSRPRRIYEY